MKKMMNVLCLATLAVVVQLRSAPPANDPHGTRDAAGSDAHGTFGTPRTAPPAPNVEPGRTNSFPANTNQEPAWTNTIPPQTNQEPPWTNRIPTNGGYQIPTSTNTIPQPAPPRR